MPVRPSSTDGSIDDPICSQLGNLAGAESELAENFIGMLSQVRRMAPQLGFGARKSRGRSHSANASSPRMLVFEKRFVRDELRVGPNRVVVVDRPARHVRSLDPL